MPLVLLLCLHFTPYTLHPTPFTQTLPQGFGFQDQGEGALMEQLLPLNPDPTPYTLPLHPTPTPYTKRLHLQTNPPPSTLTLHSTYPIHPTP